MSQIFFQRSDMAYTYEWTTSNDDPKLRGNPDHSLFSRRQGWEVLYMINKFGELHRVATVSSGRKIERMLQSLPSNVRSQANVQQWLVTNWNSF